MLRATLLISIALLCAGCGVQQVSPENRTLVLQLQSSVSSKKPDWLDATVKLIEARKAEGKLSDAEYAALRPIIEKARAGDWTTAQREAFALSEGQKPTAEDLERIKPGAKRN